MSGWHEAYRRRYAELKAAGKPFFPFAVFKDALVSLAVLLALSWLAWRYGAGLEELADPTDTTYNPRPEWYFLFLFQALKFFPGSLEAVAAVILPVAGVLFLALLPFIDRGPERHPLDRPWATGVGLAALAGIGYLTWAGLRRPLTNPAEEKNPLVAQGRRLYSELRCAYCHAIGGKGGDVGPPLDRLRRERSQEWIMRHFTDPRSVVPESAMPKLNLLDEEIPPLVAYVQSLREPFTAEAPNLFAENCAACHRVGRTGGDVGPNLSAIGAARDKAFLRRYIMDPAQSNSSSAMPSYKGQLTDEQIEDIARYLSSLGR